MILLIAIVHEKPFALLAKVVVDLSVLLLSHVLKVRLKFDELFAVIGFAAYMLKTELNVRHNFFIFFCEVDVNLNKKLVD